MKQKHLLQALLLAVSLMFVAISCTPKAEEPDAPTLSLSTNAVTVSNVGGDAQTVTVTTNQPKFSVAETADWLTATLSGKDVKITATPNTTQKERKGNVLVLAGGLIEKITVTQGAAELVLSMDINPKKLVAPASGKSFLVDVRANSGDWTIEKDVDWIEIQKFSAGFVYVTVAKNEGDDARSTKLTAVLGLDNQEIEVEQAAGKVKYGIPLFASKLDGLKIIKYERNNGNELQKYEEGFVSSWFGAMPTTISFLCSYDVFFDMQYTYAFPSDMLNSIIMRSKKSEELTAEKYAPYLKEYGFEPYGKSTPNKYVLRNTEKLLEATVSISEDLTKAYSGVLFSQYFIQPPLKTFDKMPYETEYLIEGAKIDVVKEREAAKGHNFFKEYTVAEVEKNPKHKHAQEIYGVRFKNADTSSPFLGTYFVFEWGADTAEDKLGKVAEAWQIRNDNSKVFWMNPKDELQVTEEFEELLAKEGFTLVRAQPQRNLYLYHKPLEGTDKMLNLIVVQQTLKDYNDGKPVLVMAWFLKDAEESGAGVASYDFIKDEQVKKEIDRDIYQRLQHLQR